MIPGESLSRIVYDSLKHEKLRLQHGDILAIASKIVSTCERRVIKLTDVRVTHRARLIARRWRIDEHLAAEVVNEADQILGGVNGFLLTLKNGIITPNAGVDLKNSPPGTATLWPVNPDRSARQLRRKLEYRFGTSIGVEIVDSHVTALRLGTVGLAIGVSGFNPVQDRRGTRDLFGRSIRVTQTNLADDLAAAAHFLMGESVERIGAVLIRGASVEANAVVDSRLVILSRKKCLIGNSLSNAKQSV